MDQHQSGVDEIERIVGQWIRYDVVATYAEVGMSVLIKKSSIDIGSQH